MNNLKLLERFMQKENIKLFIQKYRNLNVSIKLNNKIEVKKNRCLFCFFADDSYDIMEIKNKKSNV